MTSSSIPVLSLLVLMAATPVQAKDAGTPAGPAPAQATPTAPILSTTPPTVDPAPAAAAPAASSPADALTPIAPPAPRPVSSPAPSSPPPSPSGVTPAAQNAAPQPGPAAPSPTLAIVNNAKLEDQGEKDGISPAILRAEVMLDRVHASPGVIDGRNGANFNHALETYEAVKGLKPSGGLNPAVWSALLAESGGPVLMDHVLTPQDVQGPFYPDLPTDYAKLATLPSIGYRSPSQKIGATFHMGEVLLAALNPGVDLSKAGSKIVVAIVTPTPIHDKVASIVVDKTKSQVLGFDRNGTLLVAYPATIGSEELPSPSGTYKIKGIAYNPAYYYDPKNFLQGDNKGKLKLPPGPNNPVGSVFMALTKPTYGLHGTPDPSKIDKAASHGCVRMTNWDANELAHLVKRGVVVQFKG